ncbi:MAG: hypothetical protein JW861_02225 [Bacteroidales bacterium]|nr:hypothetical protein [Bacteroidales bacterium]
MERLIKLLFIAAAGIALLAGCKKETKITEVSSGKIIICFDHRVDDLPMVRDSLMYTNEAGNPYMINEIQYFISDFTLYGAGGSQVVIDDWKDIHYVDTDIPETWTWEVYDEIPQGWYDSVSFTFGITAEKNKSFMYVNPPERDMFWPEYLGGGYHYLKLNGKWLPAGQAYQTRPFDFHLGIGQIYFSYPDSITGYVQNYFTVCPPGSALQVINGQSTKFNIVMNIENWFKEPHIYDHDQWGGYIMQNQDAMALARENGHNVFTLELCKK